MLSLGNNISVRATGHKALPWDEMRAPFYVSIGFHFVLLLLAIFGLPFWKHKPIDIEMPISVEMVDPSDMARTDKLSDPAPKVEPPKVVQPPIVPPTPPPAPSTPPPPTPPTPQPQAEPLPELKPLEATNIPLPKFMPLPQLAKPAVVKPPEPKVTPPDPQRQKQQDDQFQSMLKNLSKTTPAQQQPSDRQAEQATQPQTAPGQRATVSDRLTGDEMERVRQQLSGCWVFPAGARNAADLSVEIEAYFNPNRTLKMANIVDTERYNRDAYYRAAADSAMRALRNPACNPLMLPPAKYDDWQHMTIVFNPKQMLGL